MIYLFDKDEQLIKLIRKDVIKTTQQKFELKDGYVSDRLTVEMRMLSDDDLQKVEYMAIQSINDTHDFHYFWIAQKNNTDNITTLVGVQSGIEELQKTVVYDQRPKDRLAKPVIDRLLEGTNWRARFIGGNQTRSTNFYYISTFEALKKVCSVWGLEMQFFVEMNGNKVGARYIDFKERIGKAVGSRVVYGHNALQILQEVERTNIYTALIGRGKGEETENGGFGRKLTFEDVEWTTPVAKPKGQKYVEIPSMTALFGIKNADGTMRPKIGTVDFQDETDANNLLKLTYEQLVNVSRPQVTFKTSTAYISNAEIGDTIRVVRHDKHIDYETRIFEITFNRLNDQSADIKLGDNIKGEAEKRRIQSVVSESLDGFVENELKPAFEKLPEFLATADGKNTNWYSDEDPTVQYPGKVLINDIWYKPDPEFEGEKIMLRWTGEAWEEILRTSDPDRIKRSINQQFEDFNTSYDESKALQDQQIADVLAKAGSAEDLANQAKTDAASAVQRSSQLKEEAVAEADRLVQAQSTALTERIQSVDVRVDDVANQVSSKVSQVDFDAVKKTVESNSTAITQNQSAIELKADKTVTDALATAVNQTKSELKITSDAVATKVSKTDFDATNQRLSTAETTIRTQAGQIEQRLTSTQVESAITSKGYQTKAQVDNNITGRGYITNSALQPYALSTTVQNLVQETADSFSRTISETRALIPTSAGSVNYIRDFSFAKNHNFSNNQSSWRFERIEDGTARSGYHIKATCTQSGGGGFHRVLRDLRGAEWQGRTMTYSVDIKASKTVRMRLGAEAFNKGYKAFDVTTDWQRFVSTDTISHKNYYSFPFYTDTTAWAVGDVVYLRDPQLEDGNIATTAHAAPEDFATVTALHAVKDTVDSHTRTIGDIEGNVSQVTQTAQGLVSQVGSLIDNQNLVYDPTNYSKYAQREANSNITRMIMPGYKLIKITQSGLTANAWRGFKMPLHIQRFTQGEKLSYRVVLFVDVVPDDILGFEIKNGGDIIGTFAFQPTQTGGNQIFTGTFTIAKTTLTTDDYGLHVWLRRNGQVNIGQISIVRGDVPPTTFVDSTSAMQLATETQVSQLSGSWAVKNLTSNGAVLNQINLLADGTNRIDGRLTHITGSTLIDNGVIKSAMIGNAQINTAHIGTIDAGQANIINIDASNITSGTITGINMRGGELEALNGNSKLNLQTGNFELNSNNSSIRRISSGRPTQFFKFFDDDKEGVSRTTIGSNRSGGDNDKTGAFTGIRIFNGYLKSNTSEDNTNVEDSIDIVADTIDLVHSAEDQLRKGWRIRAYTNSNPHNVILEPYRWDNTKPHLIYATDFRQILNMETKEYRSVSAILSMFNINFKHLINITGRGDVIETF